jgi:hypothetical protein
MDKIFVCCFFVFINFSCESQDSNTPIRKEIEFEFSKKTLLQTEDNYPNPETALFGFLKNDTNTYSFIATNIQTLLKFNNKGGLTYRFGKNYLKKDYQLPNLPPVGFDYYGDTTFILYPNKSIYKIHQNQLLDKINLQVPSEFIITRSNIFHYIPEKKQFVLSCGKYLENMKLFFSENSPLSIFNYEGKFVRNMGTYPKEYIQDGRYFHSSLTTTKGFIEQNNIYLLYDNFSKIYQYDLSGNLLKTIELPESKYRNTEFKFSAKQYDEMPTKQARTFRNDAYIGGFSKVKGKDIFFYSFYSHKKNKIILCKYDIGKNTFLETILPPIASFISLFPHCFQENKVNILLLNSQSDEVYIYEVQME